MVDNPIEDFKDRVDNGINNLGRFPANFIHDGSDEVLELFPNENGSAARFFYCAKTSKSERNAGCDELDEKENLITNQSWKCKKCNKFQLSGNGNICKCENPEWIKPISKNNHPTVKPLKLMQYLVRLVTPKNGIVLDPFMGSGTTAVACVNNNFKYIGFEKEEEYVRICEARLKGKEGQERLF